MREWLGRLADWFRRERLDVELQEELRFHRDHLERDARAAGVPDAEASYAARRRLGNRTMITESARERWSLPTLDQLGQDVRYAIRSLRRSPAFTATAVATLALGIGANAAMFIVVDRLMFRPYPYLKDPGSVHRVYWKRTNERGEDRIGWGGIEYTRYMDLQRFTTAFSEFATFAHPMLAIGVGDAARERRIATVSGSYWSFFDARPALGRFFTPAEDSPPRGSELVVLGHGFWQTEFGGRNVIGERLQVAYMPVSIVGVAPRGFTGVLDSEEPAAFIPVTLYAGSDPRMSVRNNYFTTYDFGWLAVMARRHAGVTVGRATADLSQAQWNSYQLERGQTPELLRPEIARPAAVAGAMRPAAGPDPGLEARIAVWLTGVAAIVLIIACANVANLFLARGLRRRRELAVRLALGVSRRRLAAQSVTETLILASAGCAVGLALAHWGGASIRTMLVAESAASADIFTDWRTLSAASVVTLAAALLTAVPVCLLSVRHDIAAALKVGTRDAGHQRSRTRAALLVAQSALSVALLVGAGLFVASLQNVRSMRMGYDADRALIVFRNLRGMRLDSARLVAQRRELLQSAQSIPGVAHAAWMHSVPLASTSATALFVLGIDSVNHLGSFTYQLTTPDYFSAMGTRLLRGRTFTSDDRDGAPRVAVVSNSMASVLWPGRDALGQCLRIESRAAPCTTVVGIAEDIVQRAAQLEDSRRYHYYLPIEQYRASAGNWLVLRVHGDAAAQLENVRKALQTVMPGDSYVTVRRLSELVDGAQRAWRLGSAVFVAFGFLALVVAAVGLYGAIAYNVTQRMHELGVRAALGARRLDMLRLVVTESIRITLVGAVLGCALALAASRWIEPLLFQQPARDPAIYSFVVAAMIVVALLAAVLPAMRAARADPMVALRAT